MFSGEKAGSMFFLSVSKLKSSKETLFRVSSPILRVSAHFAHAISHWFRVS